MTRPSGASQRLAALAAALLVGVAVAADAPRAANDAGSVPGAAAPEQQQAVRIAYLRFKELPQQERDWLTERWRPMTPDVQVRAVQRRQAPGPQPGAMDNRPCPSGR